jgi:hypothetical protein
LPTFAQEQSVVDPETRQEIEAVAMQFVEAYSKPASDSTYEASRSAEIQARAELYRLRLEKQQAELLDARLLRTELAATYEAISTIILATRMSDREKKDCLRNLRSIDEIFARVLSMQNAEIRRSDGNGKSHHSEDELP